MIRARVRKGIGFGCTKPRGSPFVNYRDRLVDDDDDHSDDDFSVLSANSTDVMTPAPPQVLPTQFLGVTIRRDTTPLTLTNINTAMSDESSATKRNERDKGTSNDDDSTRPLTPWGDKCRAKQNIISELNNPSSDIHLFLGTPSTDFKQTNIKKLHEKYAMRYKLSNFRNNIKLVLTHFEKKSGPFAKKDDVVEPWTSRSKRSTGWHLLYGLRMDPSSNDVLNAMSVEQIWKSNKAFTCYPLKDFENYNKAMIKLTDTLKKELSDEESIFQKYCTDFPAAKETDRGEPFWYNHKAKSLLAEDVESGLAFDIKPGALRQTRVEYQQFSPWTFRKHVHQEKEKQRAAPYWRLKRNIAARQQLEKEREEMRQQWTVDRLGERLSQRWDWDD